MDGPVTLLLVVSLAGGEARLGQLRATLTAQLDGKQVRLSVRRADGVADLEQMLEAASQKGPVAVVTNPKRGRFELKVALKPGAWVRRSFTFAPGDPGRERNRTVALAIASMTPEWRLLEPLPEVEPEPEVEPPVSVPRLGEADPLPPPPLPPPEAADAGQPSEVPEPDVGPGADAGMPVPAEGGDAGVDGGPAVVLAADPPPTAAAERGPLDGARFEVAADGATWPLGGGALVGGHYCVGHLCGGLLLRGQQASVPAANADVVRISAQLVGRLQLLIWADRLGAAVQLAAGPGWVQARRATQQQDRWQLDAELAPELWLRLFGGVSAFLRVGVGVTSGPTPIYVNDTQVSELPIASGHGTVGVRLGL